MTKKDYTLGILSGLLIGFLFLPVLNAIKPEIFGKIYLFVVPFFLIAVPAGLLIFSLIGKKIPVIWQIGKFGVIGVLNTLVDWGVMAFGIFFFRKYLQIDSTDLMIFGLTFYTLYKSISFIVANINSFYWNKYWTFQQSRIAADIYANQDELNERREGFVSPEFLQFFVISILGFAINVGLASYVFGSIVPIGGLNFDQWGIVGAAVGSIVGLLWNFVGYKFIVFK